MTQRLNYFGAAPKAIEPLIAVAKTEDLVAAGLEPALIELVKIRASQINGCANCLHMHTADARKGGEGEERIYLLSAWRESQMYTPRERAALAWTESLTRLPETGAPDEDFALVRSQFKDDEIVWLTMLIAAINSWNRIAVGFRVLHPHDKHLAVKEAA